MTLEGRQYDRWLVRSVQVGASAHHRGHAAFGLGVVTGARDHFKIDILFAGGANALQPGH